VLIHPWDAAGDEEEWRTWLAAHDFGQLAVNGPPGEPPFVQPLHFAYDHDRREVVTHLARPNPLWAALEANPQVTLSVVDDHAFIPGPWHAVPDSPPEHGVPTSYYTAVQLLCTARVVDDPAGKSDLLNRQLAHFQPPGTTAPVTPHDSPFSRLLPNIRALLLDVTDVRAKFKYGGNKPVRVQQRVTTLLSGRAAPRDAAARAIQLRRLAASADPG
jgi:transcriptional regulator